MTKERTTCRCCDGGPLVGYFGLCGACSEAVERFIRLRKRNLSPEYLARVAAWRSQNA